jgi:hypothetical protein
MEKTLPWLLLLFGLALLLGSLAYRADSLTSQEPKGLGETIGAWLTTLAGIGALVISIINLRKKDAPSKNTTINNSGDHPQTTTGKCFILHGDLDSTLEFSPTQFPVSTT